MPNNQASQITSQNNSSASARIIKLSNGQQLAFSFLSCIEVLEEAEIIYLPASSDVTLGLISWQNRWIPLISLEPLISTQTNAKGVATKLPKKSAKLAMVVGFNRLNESTNETYLEFGAINIDTLPTTVSVSNDMACTPPEDALLNSILPYCTSCLQLGDDIIPIVSISKLFG